MRMSKKAVVEGKKNETQQETAATAPSQAFSLEELTSAVTPAVTSAVTSAVQNIIASQNTVAETQEETQEENRTPKQNAVKKEKAEQKEGAQQKTAATVTTASTEATCGSPARVYRCRYGSSVILKKDYWVAKSIDSTCTPVWAWLKEDGGIDRLLTPEELIKNCP